MLKLLLIASIAIPTAAIAAEDKSDKRERRICKRQAETGSLVKARRNCLTESEWKRAQENTRQGVEDWQTQMERGGKNG
jgi:hypothetical protein